ncbi:MAG: hypothetical protein ACJ8ER_01735 [Allosphingosinicella sp.]
MSISPHLIADAIRSVADGEDAVNDGAKGAAIGGSALAVAAFAASAPITLPVVLVGGALGAVIGVFGGKNKKAGR